MEATERAPLSIHRRAAPGAEASSTLTLDFEKRQRSRFLARLDDGREVAVRLPREGALRTGDRLEIEGGEVVRVVGAAEALIEVTAATPLLFARACYHMGNRHVPLQIDDGRFRFKPDHVLEAMLASLGARLTKLDAAFDPEPGAYEGGGHAHGHSHGDLHRHSHGDSHGEADGGEPAPAAHAHPHGHDHDASHGHGHATGKARIHLMDDVDAI